MPLLKAIEAKSERKLSKLRIDNDKEFINAFSINFIKKERLYLNLLIRIL